MSSTTSSTETNNIIAISAQRKLEFLTEHTPDEQMVVAKNVKDAIMGDHMELSVMAKHYGEDLPVAWLVPQLYNLSEFCGCKEKLNGHQLQELADIIYIRYGYLKMTELLLFFHRFKTGDYGTFYGSVDPLKIMNALRQFIVERNDMLAHYEQEEHERQRMESYKRNPPSSYEDYLKAKAAGLIKFPPEPISKKE